MPSQTQTQTLPMPHLERWQPLRIGLVELFLYDSEEFWFRDGHLLLRGNNGTGKSKVLSLTMPLLFDASLKPSRVEPDGDGGKKMAWNLLQGGMDRRVGYAWIEFGRVERDGTTRFLTLGAGLSAVAARPQVDSWYFILEGTGDGPSAASGRSEAADAPPRGAASASERGGPRLNRDLWLTTDERVVLGKERLREALHGRGQVFEHAGAYRRAVDERLFRLGQSRYDALIDTLIQLRQPQLSKKPNEAALSDALGDALPPIAPELLADVADAFGQLEDDRHQLEQYERLVESVARFEKQYRVYAGTKTRRQARELRQAQTEFDNASRSKANAQAELEAAEIDEARLRDVERDAGEAVARHRAEHEALLLDPINADAGRLEQARRDAQARADDVAAAAAALETARSRHDAERRDTADLEARLAAATQTLARRRSETIDGAAAAGLQRRLTDLGVTELDGERVSAMAPAAFDALRRGLRDTTTARRDEVKRVRQRLAQLRELELALAGRRDARDDAADAAEDADRCRALADEQFEKEGRTHTDAWASHVARLVVLKLEVADDVTRLAEWVIALDGEHPARHALEAARQAAAYRHAKERADLEQRRAQLDAARSGLEAERAQLRSGVDPQPVAPAHRDPDARRDRSGAPLWHLVDFHDGLTAAQRAGIEAALEASGLLDAWVAPEGTIQRAADGAALLDTQAIERSAVTDSLARWLKPSLPAPCDVPRDVMARVLEGVACSELDDEDVAAWVSPQGRYRMGSVAGAWSKRDAEFIGFTARAAARARRLAEVERLLDELRNDADRLDAAFAALAAVEAQADVEWRTAPTDDGLRACARDVDAAMRDVTTARAKLATAEDALRKAEAEHLEADQRLAHDAADLLLPRRVDDLEAVEAALDRFHEHQLLWGQTAGDLRSLAPDMQRQRERDRDAADAVAAGERRLETSNAAAVTAQATYDVLERTVGVEVEALLQQLAAVRSAVTAGEAAHRHATAAKGKAAEARALASANAQRSSEDWQRRSDDRTHQVAQLQRFAASGLLLAGVPGVELPALDQAWTIDPALTLARRAEQALADVKDDDETWARVQKHIGVDLSEMQGSLSALGFQSTAEQTDFGQVVTVVYRNRPERPDRLIDMLDREIADRKELLTAREREILEGHLQAEIAAEVQRLIKAADRHVAGINAELEKHPTSTGVKFRLLWQPLSEEEGAPVGFADARQRLLNRSTDLWTAEDRRVVGAMLQRRIEAERERTDAGAVEDAAGGLPEQLARALDYRSWHRFRVERWQDRAWRKLSGPASSGERALGLTVPLFAAVASFYGQGDQTLAPRLILLDEAFAGIDDAARAHCMALVREFDLDFIITSEREWGCYAELPGVSICQLQRKEGVDAVYVSRWTWDGKAKRREADPDQRFAARR